MYVAFHNSLRVIALWWVPTIRWKAKNMGVWLVTYNTEMKTNKNKQNKLNETNFKKPQKYM